MRILGCLRSRAIAQLVAKTTIRKKGNSRFATGVSYPNLEIKLEITNKANMVLSVMSLTADVYFEGLFAGSLLYVGNGSIKIPRKGEEEIDVQFAPPIQVFLDRLLKCDLRNGVAELQSSLGRITLPFSEVLGKIDNADQALQTISTLLQRTIDSYGTLHHQPKQSRAEPSNSKPVE